MKTIRKANSQDYRRLLSSLRFVFKANPYINIEYLKADISCGNCYIFEEDGKTLAIASLVYDDEHRMHYIKRLAVPNKRRRSKGYAKQFIEVLKDMAPIVAATPWEENVAMRKSLEQLGFTHRYTFNEYYMLYTSV